MFLRHSRSGLCFSLLLDAVQSNNTYRCNRYITLQVPLPLQVPFIRQTLPLQVQLRCPVFGIGMHISFFSQGFV